MSRSRRWSKADGTLQPEVVKNLLQIGNWLNKNGQAIYSTVNAAHYNDGKVWFTADKNGKTLYAIYALEDGEKTLRPLPGQKTSLRAS